MPIRVVEVERFGVLMCGEFGVFWDVYDGIQAWEGRGWVEGGKGGWTVGCGLGRAGGGCVVELQKRTPRIPSTYDYLKTNSQ